MSRKWQLAVVLLVLVASFLLWRTRGHGLRPGDTVDAPVTLVPADSGNLACALTESVGRYRCRYNDDGAPGPAVEAQALLAPYLTTDRTPYLIPGLFETSGLVRYVAAHHDNVRFTTHCQLRLVSLQSHYRLRFVPADPWADGPPAWVAEVTSCEVP